MARRKSRKSSGRRRSETRSAQASTRPRDENGRFLSNAEIMARAPHEPDEAMLEQGEVFDNQDVARQEEGVRPVTTGKVDLNTLADVLESFDQQSSSRSEGYSPLERSMRRKERRLHF